VKRAEAIAVVRDLLPPSVANMDEGEMLWAGALDLDSVSALELVLALEAQLGRTIAVETLTGWDTVGDVVSWLEAAC
jgi:acyl carrier protein